MISIVTATYNSLPWIELFIKSIRRFTNIGHEIIVIDNGSGPESLTWLRTQKDIHLFISDVDFDSPGAAMDRGTELAHGEYICFLDSDAHIQRIGWDKDIIDIYNGNPKTRLFCKAGPMNIGRPVHPPIFFYEKSFFREHGLSFRYQKGVEGSTDTAQKTYWDILQLGYNVERINRGKVFYGLETSKGDFACEIWINGQPTIYHHNYGSRLRLCGDNKWKWECYYDIPAERKAIHESRTAALFNEPLVKDILAGN
jgi:glycosyltransferase involved in cell wall biosynthesis